MKCYICENDQKFFALSPEFCQTQNYLCGECGLVFIPSELSIADSYYTNDGYFKKSPNLSLKKKLINKNLLISSAQKRIQSLVHTYPIINFDGKTVLDVGCAYGEILYYLKQNYGTSVLGIEASVETAVIGKEMFKVPIESALFKDFKTTKKFDVILCCHTLEHSGDPISFLMKVRQLLNKEGLFYLEVPNIFRPTGGFSLKSFLYEEHLHTFSAYNLDLLLRKVNLYTVAYSDITFLKFLSQAEQKNIINIPEKASGQVLDFLKSYKNNYNSISYLKVYLSKFNYLLKLLYFKVFKR